MAIISDANIEQIPYDAETVFFERILKADKEAGATHTDEEIPSEPEHKADEPEEEITEETSDESPEESEGEETEGEETEEKPAKDKKSKIILEADADAVVKHKVDGKDIEIPVKDLTRLYGQEASLTRKSQELSEVRKSSDTALQKYVAGVETLLQRAQAEYEPYSKINFLALAKDPDISGDDLAVLQSQAQKAYQNVEFLKGELDGTVQQHQQARHQRLLEEAKKGWDTLSNPETGIKGWGEPLYKEVRGYALSTGLAKQVVDELVDPAAIKILHKAMLYDKGQKAMVSTKKVDKNPKKVIRSSSEQTTTQIKSKSSDASAMAKLKKSGSQDDAMEVFLARMQRTE